MAKNKGDALPSPPMTDMSSPTLGGNTIISPSNSTTSNSTTLSRPEANTYYYQGLPSAPSLVARTSTKPLDMPTGLEAYPKKKELRVVGNHPINDIWEAKLANQVLDLLDEKWTSVDVVRIGYASDPLPPVVVWIGVFPGSLSANDGQVVVSTCKELFKEYDGLADVEVEIRESRAFKAARLP